MLHINDLTYRIDGRLLIDQATVALPEGHKLGLVGRNGTGKTTLFKLVLGELQAESGSLSVPRNARIGTVAQEAPGGEASLLDTVLAADTERACLLEEAETATDPARVADIHTRLADIEAHSAPSRAATILAGLGFSQSAQEGPCSALSGGWRMRVALAAALFASPDVLLLDEPTNYLDLEGVIWLKTYLKTYRYTVLIISHDRDLLNEAVQGIVHLDQRKLSYYQGNYDNFERQRREKQALQLKLKKKQEDTRRHMEAFVERFRYKASKARQAQSRLKALEKMQPVADIIEDRVAAFHFKAAEKRINPPLVRFDKASAGYDGKAVLNKIDLRIDDDDRIALLGANGNGKSTFAKLLCGKIKPLAGHMRHHNKLKVAYFAQHQLDELDAEKTPYDYFRQLMPDATEAQRRARLGAHGFGVEHVQTTSSNLSGGEKARLLFAIASFEGPHILVLDEPTNHLDVAAREALVHAINDFEGAVILISHDRHLIETTADRLWLVHDGAVKPYEGDLTAYSKLVLEQARDTRRSEKQKNRSRSAGGSQTGTVPAGPPKINIQALQKKADARTAELEALEEKIRILDAALADPQLYVQEPEKAQKYAKLRKRLASDLGKVEAAWLKAQDTLEAEMARTSV